MTRHKPISITSRLLLKPFLATNANLRTDPGCMKRHQPRNPN